MSIRARLAELDRRVLPASASRELPAIVRGALYFLSLAGALLVPGLMRHETVGVVAAGGCATIGLALLTYWWFRRRRVSSAGD